MTPFHFSETLLRRHRDASRFIRLAIGSARNGIVMRIGSPKAQTSLKIESRKSNGQLSESCMIPMINRYEFKKQYKRDRSQWLEQSSFPLEKCVIVDTIR